jgi:hypothetical protein
MIKFNILDTLLDIFGLTIICYSIYVYFSIFLKKEIELNLTPTKKVILGSKSLLMFKIFFFPIVLISFANIITIIFQILK